MRTCYVGCDRDFLLASLYLALEFEIAHRGRLRLALIVGIFFMDLRRLKAFRELGGLLGWSQQQQRAMTAKR
jgi:hypothetical protein